jgi:hypothetical protein
MKVAVPFNETWCATARNSQIFGITRVDACQKTICFLLSELIFSVNLSPISQEMINFAAKT